MVGKQCLGKDGQVDEGVAYWTMVVSDKVVLLHSAERAVCQEQNGMVTQGKVIRTYASLSLSLSRSNSSHLDGPDLGDRPGVATSGFAGYDAGLEGPASGYMASGLIY